MRTPDGSGSALAPSERRRSNARFLGIWFVVVFVFFSIPRSKLGTYILPALPPLAIVEPTASRAFRPSMTRVAVVFSRLLRWRAWH